MARTTKTKARDLPYVMNKEQRIAALKENFEETLDIMGIDRNTKHFTDTPARMARMYINELFCGLYDEAPKFTVFEDSSKDMVFLGNIDVFSTCGHHFKAFIGKAHIGYIPNGNLVGISKLARITDWFARRPQVQEDLTSEIADYLMQELKPQGVGVDISCVHNCIRTRGAKQSESEMFTTALRGCFLDDASIKAEFNSKIQRCT